MTIAIACTCAATSVSASHEHPAQRVDNEDALSLDSLPDPRLLRPNLTTVVSDSAVGDTTRLVRVAGVGDAGLRLRTGPSLRFPATVILREAAIVRLTGAIQTDDEGASWLEVIGWRGESLRGWSASRYLQPADWTAVSDEQCDSITPIQGRVLPVTLTAYSYQAPGAGANGTITKTGEQARWGIVAVDPGVIPLGSRLAIDGYQQLFRAEDTGFGIRGSHIDLFVPSEREATEFGVQYRDVIVFN